MIPSPSNTVATVGTGPALSAPARLVRLACRAADMRDEFTGAKLYDEAKIPQDVVARKVAPAGAYAVRIWWSDGHESLFSYGLLRAVLAGAA